MKLATVVATLLLANTARADCAADDFECGLSVVELGQTPSAAPRLKSQLVERDTKTPKVVGAVSGIAGGLSLVAAWTLYVARANYRLEPRYTVGPNEISHWETLGDWSMYLGMGGAAGLVLSEALLLPEADGPSTFAWFGGAVGLGVAAVGVGYAVGATSCAPLAVRPAAEIPQSCLSGTADALLGPLLISTASPLLAWPMTYLVRVLFAGEPESLTVGGRGVRWRMTF